jgi:hypothetical protein
LAVSPDGQWVATVNMRGTALPADSPRFDEHGSVSLFRLGATGSDGAGLQVYRVGSEDEPGLTPVQRIPLPHGVHHVVAD